MIDNTNDIMLMMTLMTRALYNTAGYLSLEIAWVKQHQGYPFFSSLLF